MFEQDYVMRLIKEMIRAVLRLFFNINAEAPAAELLEDEEQRKALDSLLDMVDAGKINEAENRLCDLICGGSAESLETALIFYACLNDKTDAFLLENDFSREEIRAGVEKVAECLGLGGMAGLFLEEI